MCSNSDLPKLPKSSLELPVTPLIMAALQHCKKLTSLTTVNHCIRSAYFAVLLSHKLPHRGSEPLDLELVVYCTIMHDLGWATDKSLLSKDKRFEVDSANMASSYIKNTGLASDWDKHRVQLMWDAIALHATPSFALHKEPEVILAHLGVMADFFGPNLPGGMITVEEHREIVHAFPRLGFKEQFLNIMCGLCAYKPDATYDNFVGDFGTKYGIDGEGAGKEEYYKERLTKTFPETLYPAIAACEQYEG